MLSLCLDAFRWTDGESTIKVASFCGAVVNLAMLTDNVELRQFVCKDLFSGIIQGLALESNAFTSADLVSLCREIFVNFCKDDPTPRQVSNFSLFFFSLGPTEHNRLYCVRRVLDWGRDSCQLDKKILQNFCPTQKGGTWTSFCHLESSIHSNPI